MDGYSILALKWSDSHHFASTADWHVLGECDLGGHHEGKFNSLSLRWHEVGAQECPAGA
jgi:hypothetical protein